MVWDAWNRLYNFFLNSPCCHGNYAACCMHLWHYRFGRFAKSSADAACTSCNCELVIWAKIWVCTYTRQVYTQCTSWFWPEGTCLLHRRSPTRLQHAREHICRLQEPKGRGGRSRSSCYSHKHKHQQFDKANWCTLCPEWIKVLLLLPLGCYSLWPQSC